MSVTAIVLAGGWGYENLGDEAILAGYIEFLRDRTEFTVASTNPNRTARAQRELTDILPDGRHARASTLLVGGGGYLNGRWKPEIYKKLWDLRTMAQGKVVAHAVEVRRIQGAVQERLFRSTFRDSDFSVRDLKSTNEVLHLIGSHTHRPVVPDAISLLVPHLDLYGGTIPELQGKVLLNLVDFPNRPDSDEADIDGTHWRAYITRLSQALGHDAIGLVMGAGDRSFMQRAAPGLPLLEPTTVADLISVLRSARGVLSVRMHPALLASALGTPVASIPYCGKVKPTLRRIGVDDRILTDLDVEATLDLLATDLPAHADGWSRAHAESSAWLERSLGFR